MTALPADLVRPAYYCAAALIRTRRRTGEPIPAWLRRHYDQLDTAIRVSESRHESDCCRGESEPEKLITAREAAAILRLSKRQTQRVAPDLGGRIVDGRWIFRLSAVTEYAKERTTECLTYKQP